MKYAVRNKGFGYIRDLEGNRDMYRRGTIALFDTYDEAFKHVGTDPVRWAGKREVVKIRWTIKCTNPDCHAQCMYNTGNAGYYDTKAEAKRFCPPKAKIVRKVRVCSKRS